MTYQRQRILCSFLTMNNLMDYLRDSAPEEQQHLTEFLDKSDQSQKKLARLAYEEKNISETIQRQALPPSHDKTVEKLRHDPIFKNSFRHRDVSFETVQTDLIVTVQNTIHLDYIDELKKQFENALDPESLSSICLGMNKSYVAPVNVSKVNDATFLFTSDSQDLRLLGTQVNDLKHDSPSENRFGIPQIGLTFVAGYMLPAITLASIGRKLFLINGAHKIFALRQLGVTHVPAIVINDLRLEDLPADLPMQKIFSLPRKPLLKDFLDPDMVIDVKMKPKKRAIQVKVTTETLSIPI